jgi:hypothetical protein
MDTFPLIDRVDRPPHAFEIENVYVSRRRAARILSAVPGVTKVHVQRLFQRSDHRVEFEYQGRPCVVWEPFGDNSRFWIGPRDPDGRNVDITAIEAAFLSYRPNMLVHVLGSLVSLRPFRSRTGRRHAPRGPR